MAVLVPAVAGVLVDDLCPIKIHVLHQIMPYSLADLKLRRRTGEAQPPQIA